MKIFNVVVNVRGFSRERDDMILKSLERRDRRLFNGSGFSFFNGTRDLGFETYKKDIAERLQKNLRAALKKNKIRGSVKIWTDERDW